MSSSSCGDCHDYEELVPRLDTRIKALETSNSEMLGALKELAEVYQYTWGPIWNDRISKLIAEAEGGAR